MRWCFFARCNDQGRMQSRITRTLDHLLTPAASFSMARLDESLFFSFVVEADCGQAIRIESLLLKLYGMQSVTCISEASTMRRMIALIRVRCDFTERGELLHFIAALSARPVMIRPLWIAFEVVGTPEEVEGIYQSTLGYGLVDLVSSSCTFMSSGSLTGEPADLSDAPDYS